MREEGGGLSVRRQCALLGLPRSSFYYGPLPESEADLRLMRLIDEEYLRRPFYGSRRMTEYLRSLEYEVNRKPRLEPRPRWPRGSPCAKP